MSVFDGITLTHSRPWERPSLAEFKRGCHRNDMPLWRVLLRLGFFRWSSGFDRRSTLRWQGWYVAFRLHVRVPNGRGFYATGVDHVGARWCWPWQWYRLYYAARFPAAVR